MKKIFILIQVLFLSQLIFAQNFDAELEGVQDSLPKIISKLHLEQDSRLNTMVKRHIENNHKKNGVDGWRVEIFFSSDSDAKQKALLVKQEFLSEYPEIEVHIKFNSPYFKVRVGDFRTRNEALKLRKKLMSKYPKSFEVNDVIKFPNLLQ